MRRKKSQMQWRTVLRVAVLPLMIAVLLSIQQLAGKGAPFADKVDAQQETSSSTSVKSYTIAETKTSHEIVASDVTMMQQKINALYELKVKAGATSRHKHRRIFEAFINLQHTANAACLNLTAANFFPEKGWNRSQSRYG